MRTQWAVGDRQKAVGRQQKPEEKPSVRNLELKAFVCLLPTAYCLLPTAYCLLPDRRVGDSCRLRGINVDGVAV